MRFWGESRFGAVAVVLAALLLATVPVWAAEPAASAPPLQATPATTATLEEPADDGTPTRVRLISSEQYLNTIAFVFGEDIKLGTPFPPMSRTDGLLEAGPPAPG